MSKTKDTVTVPTTLLENAWVKWLEFHYGLDGGDCSERFCRFIDPEDINEEVLDYWGMYDKEEYEVLPEIARRLQLLAGPHYHTVIKAYYARHPWK